VDEAKSPKFELAGPPCRNPGCNGVLIDASSFVTKEVFRRCSACSQTFDRLPASQALLMAKATIERILKGEKSS